MDIYLLTSSGETILALKQDDKSTDTLYSINESGSITGQKKSPGVWDIRDSNKDGNTDSKDGITVRSGLIEQLTSPRYKDEIGTAYTSIGEQSEQNEKDYFELFKYISDNAKKMSFLCIFLIREEKIGLN